MVQIGIMTPTSQPLEIELKFALPALDPVALATSLARLPALVRRKPAHIPLHNVYYDTPEQTLRGKRMALRLRQIGSVDNPQWVQTLKIGGNAESALSQRGEWEQALPVGQINQALLQATPWHDFDPAGLVFDALRPCFITCFERTCWTLKKRDGSCVEVALDIGQVSANNLSTPLCELEIELIRGAPEALFDTARSIARSIPLLPLNVSKAERGYRLAQGSLHAPLRARAPALSDKMDLTEIARTVLREMFLQFSANLATLKMSDDPEVLHQARIGWRRFRSAFKFFGKHVDQSQIPSHAGLRPLLDAIATLRDLDVVAAETLPMLAGPYTAGDAQRQRQWQDLLLALDAELLAQRCKVRRELDEAAVGLALLEMVRWLELPWVPTIGSLPDDEPRSVSTWAKRRIERLFNHLNIGAADSPEPLVQHQVRLISKRLRYCIEALRPLLPKRRAERWYHTAVDLQTRIGANRDLIQAIEITTRLRTAEGIVAFLRGMAFGKSQRAR